LFVEAACLSDFIVPFFAPDESSAIPANMKKKNKPENLIEFPESYMHCLHFFSLFNGFYGKMKRYHLF
jgi:hypothetical protein